MTTCPHCWKPINIGSILGVRKSKRKAKASAENGRLRGGISGSCHRWKINPPIPLAKPSCWDIVTQ